MGVPHVTLSTSALYELAEWSIALCLAPDAAEAYNGQQGDMWDAHKDMTLALFGAVLSMTVIATVNLLRRESPPAASQRQYHPDRRE